MTLLSIIIPVFNSEKHIEKSIRSVTSQKFKNIEILVINDSSTDESYRKIQNISQNDYRIKSINLSKNQGVSNARNIGIQKSKSDYILFLDADDTLIKGSLTKFYNLIKKQSQKIDLVVANYRSEKIDNIQLNTNFDFKLNTKNKKPIDCIINSFKFSAVCWRYIFNRKFIIQNKIKFPKNIDINEDHLFTTLSLINAKNFFITKELLYKHNQTLSSLSNKRIYQPIIKDTLGYIKIVIEYLNILNKYRKILTVREKKFIIQRLDSSLSNFINSLLFLNIKEQKLINNFLIKNKKSLINIKKFSKNFYDLGLKKDINFYINELTKKFYSSINSNKKIIIYCKSFLGVAMIKLLKKDYNLLAIIDNNKKLTNKKIYGVKIYSINYLKKINYKNQKNYQIIICHPHFSVYKNIYKEIKVFGKLFNIKHINKKY